VLCTVRSVRDRPRLGRSRTDRTVHSTASIALGRPIPAVNKKPAAECEIQTTVQQLLITRPDNHWFRDFSLPHLHSMLPLGGGGGSRRSIAIPFGAKKLEWCGYPMVKKNWKYLYSFWHNCTNVTDTHTHRHRMTAYRPPLCIASRGKKTALEVLCYWSNEANYWQTWNIARPLGGSRAICLYLLAFGAHLKGWGLQSDCRHKVWCAKTRMVS